MCVSGTRMYGHDMKINKIYGISAAVLLTIGLSIAVSLKLGLGLLALLILGRFVWGPSESKGIIGVDHIDRPRSSSYGGGYNPGGSFGAGSIGTQFGVFGTSLADSSPEAYLKGRGLEYVTETRPSLLKKHRSEIAAAIKEAEVSTGHQILAVLGDLKEDHAAKADRIAAKWPTASIVVCIDPVRKLYELRWRDASFALDTAQLESFADMIRRSEFASAIALLAEVLPVQTAGAGLPDIIED